MRVSWPLVAGLALVAAVPAVAQSPAYLVKDINRASVDPFTSGAYPLGFVLLGGRAYFTAGDAAHGRELWRSDGTPGGTTLVADLNPGQDDSSPRDLTVIDGALWFRAWDGRRGCGVWRSDGSPAGTRLVAIVHGRFFECAEDAREGGQPTGFAGIAGAVLFAARIGDGGSELWRTDGTEAGTEPLLDINPGDAPSMPRGLVTHGGAVYFAADDGVRGTELWRSDGTAAGTRLVRDIDPGAPSGLQPASLADPYFFPVRLYVVSGGLVFAAFDSTHGVELWRSDGSEAGTSMLLDSEPDSLLNGLRFMGRIVPPFVALDAGSVAFFSVTATEAPARLLVWRSDGTALGTTAMAAVDYMSPGYIGSPPGDAARLGTGLVFRVAEQGATSLWRVDGAGGEPQRVTVPTLRVGAMTVLGQQVLFFASTGTSRCGLWRSDGTQAGTILLRDVAPTRGECPEDFDIELPGHRTAVVDGRVLLAADEDEQGVELFASDGSVSGTGLLGDLNDTRLRTGGVGLELHGSLDDRLFFSTFGGAASDLDTVGAPTGLWATDGTQAGTVLLGEMTPWWGGAVGDYFVLAGPDGVGSAIWASDGTPAGTRVIASGVGVSRAPITTSKGLFLQVNSPSESERQLWRSDGTASGTKRVIGFPLEGYSTSFGAWAAFGRGLVFIINNRDGGELWHTDGTIGGTDRIEVFPNAVADAMMEVDGTLFLHVLPFGAARGSQLWRTDATVAGAVLIQDFATSPTPARVFWLAAGPGALFFSAGDVLSGLELWRSDGTAPGTRRVRDVAPGPTGALVDPAGRILQQTGVARGALVFIADDGAHGPEPWRSDGTEAGTTLLRDFDPRLPVALANGLALSLADVGDRVLLAPLDRDAGVEPWITDGTAPGTRRLADIAPGVRSGLKSGAPFASTRTHVFFGADDGSSGYELWAMPRGAFEGGGCAGDCNGDGRVAIDELVRGVGIALGTTALDTCLGLDADVDETVSIAELVGSVADALGGC